LSLAGCGAPDVCDGFAQTCLALEVRAAPGESLTIDQLELVGLQGFEVPSYNDALTPSTPRRTALPVLVAVLPPPDYYGPYDLEVGGRLAGRTLRLGHAVGSVDVGQHMSVVAVLDLRPDGMPVVPYDFAGLDFAGLDLAGADLAEPAGALDLSSGCDPVLQSGCASAQKCTLPGGSSTAAPVCTAAGSIPVGSACTASDDQCVAGAVCLSLAAVDKVCRKLCNHDNLDGDCPEPAAQDASRAQLSHCLQLTTDGPLGACSTPCNPVTAAGPSGCPGGEMCYFVPFLNADVLGLTDCSTVVGSGTDGTVCTREVDCAPGYYCRELTQGGQLVCRQICRVGVDSDCSLSGYKCITDVAAFGGCCPSGTC
jgi:hypothetical protein